MEQIIIKPIHVLQSDPNSVTSATSIDALPCELPKFFESKENRSQKIMSRLKEVEKKVGNEVESARQIQSEEEKVSEEFLEEIKKIVQEKIDELKDKTIFQMDLILVSEILDNLAKSEENLLNFVQISFDNYTHLNEVEEDDAEEPKTASGGILKKPIAKSERQDLTKRKKIPYKAVTILKQWLFENIQDPYPSNEVKEELAKKTNLTFKQVHNWFINARGRIWKKMVNPERFGNVVEKLYVQNVAKANGKK